jgi:hypothetical protein
VDAPIDEDGGKGEEENEKKNANKEACSSGAGPRKEC